MTLTLVLRHGEAPLPPWPHLPGSCGGRPLPLIAPRPTLHGGASFCLPSPGGLTQRAVSMVVNVTESSVTFTLADRLYRRYHADSLGIAIVLYHVRCQTYEAANVWFTRDGSQFEAREEVM